MALLNNYNRSDYISSAAEEFVEETFSGDEITEIKNTIAQTEIKNALSSTFRKVPKFKLKIYAYVYDELICFPRSDMAYETITTNNVFANVHSLKFKFHLHHSHVTGKIFGYSHDFCNTVVIDQIQPDIPLIADNLFNFDLHFFIKAYVASAWCSKSLQIGGTNLTQINYANITGKIKFY